MSWINDENGERKYKLSAYAKEELPTWGEMEEFINKGIFFYDPNDENHIKEDLYWKVPRQLYLLSIVCNQLNKMIFEDGWRDKLIKFINDNIDKENIIDVRFILGLPNEINYIMQYYSDIQESENSDTKIDLNPIASIFTIPLPSGDDNLFICNDISRINIKEIVDKENKLELYPHICFKRGSWQYCVKQKNRSKDISKRIFDFMFEPYVEYFKDPIGWKDGTVPSKDAHYHLGIDLGSCK